MKELLLSLKKKAIENKNILTIGRSHGIHAEPTTMGLKFAYAYAEFERCLNRMQSAKTEIAVCKISGPVGNYSSISPKVEEYVAKKLNLKPDTISTQIIPRDRHAFYFTTISIICELRGSFTSPSFTVMLIFCCCFRGGPLPLGSNSPRRL